uniref:TEP1-F n=1 Tax=Anopheles minimus TaxID=112268 RepID=A0A182W9H7_9DIPT
MWQFISSRILTVIIFIGAAHGMLVVGPKFIRANQNYTVAISNLHPSLRKVNLKLCIDGHTDGGSKVLIETKTIEVGWNTNEQITFNIPENLPAGNYKFTVDGQRGFSFHKETDLKYLRKSIAGLIQISKPVFKPGDTVQFRVIVLDPELRPPARVNTIHVRIYDPQKNVIRQWPWARLQTGVFENELQIAPTPMLGIWNISVLMNGEELVSKTFEVKEYVLSSFDVNVYPSIIPLESHQALLLTIKADYHFGKPVIGLAKVELYLEDDELDQRKEIEVYGKRLVELRFKEKLSLYEPQQNVRVRTTFIEKHTNRTVVKDAPITVYKHKYRVELIKESPQFRPAYSFKCALQFRFHDGTPATGITGEVKVDEIGYHETATSDNNGLIKLVLLPNKDINEMTISYSNEDGFFYEEQVGKANVVTDTYFKLKLTNPVKLNEMLQLTVRCNKQMTFFVYYVVSKGNIIDTGYISSRNQNDYILKATEKMLPKARIIVATVVNRIMVYDVVDIHFEELHNNFNMSIDEQIVQPGQQVELRMTGRPGAYVGLAAYDKGLLYYNHDLFWEDFMQVFDGFHSVEENAYDKFHSAGLFRMLGDDIIIKVAEDISARDGLLKIFPFSKSEWHRTKFPESWLWQNDTIGRFGIRTIAVAVPDTTTSWYLTGFSIDPEYGFGIIKKPIQLTTIQPFYIVENLPYSIKRGEVVELHFTLFNYLGGEHIADVTLYNVDNQLEFVERPLEELNYTKSVTVPSNIGVPISFSVKARKLGEVVICVKATILAGWKTDALEKVIQVTPESLVQSYMHSRSFCSDTYINQTFSFYTDIDKKADNESKKIEFRLIPNLLPAVLNNLDGLLALPSGNGEQNMLHLGPNIVVLDYLRAIGSKDQNLIDKATSLIRQGYHKQMRYRRLDGSFGVLQNLTGGTFLTAFVAKSMQTASKYISEVDMVKIEKAFDWLATKQRSSGRFYEVDTVNYNDMRGGLRNGISLTSYVVTALLENENARVKHAVVIQRAMNYLSSQMESINNAYDLSIATYALMLNGHIMKDKAFQMLLQMSTLKNNNVERFWQTPNSIEATAYALLSFVIAEKYVDGIPVMRWLANQRYVTGSLPRTQDTFVGLKALTKMAEKISPSRNNYTIQFKIRERFQKLFLQYTNGTKMIHINSEASDVINFELPELLNQFGLSVSGNGCGSFNLFYQYSINLMNIRNQFVLELQKQNTGSNYELQLNVCASFIPTITDRHSNMVTVEVTLPSGYVVDRNPISEQTAAIAKLAFDVRYGGTSVVVYYANMDDKQNCFTVNAFPQGKVTLKRPAYVVVYDTINPNWNAIKMYEMD